MQTEAATSTATQLKAYVVSNASYERSEIVFAVSYRDARKHRLDDVEYIDHRVRREPRWDSYAARRYVPIADRLAAGWHWPCSYCGCILRGDEESLLIREDSQDVFCGEKCAAHYDGRARGWAFLHAESADAMRDAQARFPSAEVCDARFYGTAFGCDRPEEYRVDVRLSWPLASGGRLYASWSPGDGDRLSAVRDPKDLR